MCVCEDIEYILQSDLQSEYCVCVCVCVCVCGRGEEDHEHILQSEMVHMGRQRVMNH